MTDFEIYATAGKVRRVAALKADVKARDSRGALRLLEDECSRRGLDPAAHVIRGWDQRGGWLEHGGTTR